MAPSTAPHKLIPFARTEASRLLATKPQKYRSMADIMARATPAVIVDSDNITANQSGFGDREDGDINIPYVGGPPANTQAAVIGGSDDDDDNITCEQCGFGEREDELLLCDKCNRGYHMDCTRPVVDRIPIGSWFCSDCTVSPSPERVQYSRLSTCFVGVRLRCGLEKVRDDLKRDLQRLLDQDFDRLMTHQQFRLKDYWMEVVRSSRFEYYEPPFVKGNGCGKTAAQRDCTDLEHVQAKQKGKRGRYNIGAKGGISGKEIDTFTDSGPRIKASLSPVSNGDKVGAEVDPCPFNESILPFLYPFVERWKNVEADGHCGFRASAEVLGYGEQSWPMIRRALARELRESHEFWSTRLYFMSVDDLLRKIEVDTHGEVGRNHWFEDPNCSILVATVFQVAIVNLGLNCTILPMRNVDVSVRQPKGVVTLLHLGKGGGGDHYVAVWLKPNAPMPPIICRWYELRHISVIDWDIPYLTRITEFERLKNLNQLEPHVVANVD